MRGFIPTPENISEGGSRLRDVDGEIVSAVCEVIKPKPGQSFDPFTTLKFTVKLPDGSQVDTAHYPVGFDLQASADGQTPADSGQYLIPINPDADPSQCRIGGEAGMFVQHCFMGGLVPSWFAQFAQDPQVTKMFAGLHGRWVNKPHPYKKDDKFGVNVFATCAPPGQQAAAYTGTNQAPNAAASPANDAPPAPPAAAMAKTPESLAKEGIEAVVAAAAAPVPYNSLAQNMVPYFQKSNRMEDFNTASKMFTAQQDGSVPLLSPEFLATLSGVSYDAAAQLFSKG